MLLGAPPSAPPPQRPPVNGLIVEGDSSNFEQLVLGSNIPVIVDCYADWCDPCKTLTPLLEGIVSQMAGR
jgi:putative thioredoxin